MEGKAIEISRLEDIPDLSKITMFIPAHFFTREGQHLFYQMTFYAGAVYTLKLKTYDELNDLYHRLGKCLDKSKVKGYRNCVRSVLL